ncbi:MAG: Cof-type HAD-IIB family hydrolase [Streptococcaceae bacterium]|jgi:Cof subfamily protein (haloacid dehalogenase superfamily)|nr:Cof-type HAD-IIB family hydrolase [Streptococcaceae bacterium]
MNIRLIATDLDGTLLKTDKSVSDKTKQTIKECQKLGIAFVPATARDLKTLDKMNVTQIANFDAIITTNGSKIYKDGKIIYRKGLTTKLLNEFLPTILKHFPKQTISINLNEEWYANFDIHAIFDQTMEFTFSDFSDLPDGMIDRIMMDVGNQENFEKLQSILPEYMYAHTIEGTFITRVLHRDVSKAHAIEHLAEVFGISIDEILFFGDDENDVEAFELLTNKVVVANAIDKLKQKASGQTLSNDEDGVAYYIQEHVLV